MCVDDAHKHVSRSHITVPQTLGHINVLSTTSLLSIRVYVFTLMALADLAIIDKDT